MRGRRNLKRRLVAFFVLALAVVALGTLVASLVGYHRFDPNKACADHQGVRQVTNHGAVCLDGYYARDR